jgi:adenine phosphoribosyltransferase
VELEKYIRDVPGFPKEGIIFKDITTLIKDRQAFKYVIDTMAAQYAGQGIKKVVGIESRGFIFGGAVAYQLDCGLVLARKPGKLPAEAIKEDYTLEYGTNSLEMHTDAIEAGERVIIVDDLLATGGTAGCGQAGGAALR